MIYNILATIKSMLLAKVYMHYDDYMIITMLETRN